MRHHQNIVESDSADEPNKCQVQPDPKCSCRCDTAIKMHEQMTKSTVTVLHIMVQDDAGCSPMRSCLFFCMRKTAVTPSKMPMVIEPRASNTPLPVCHVRKVAMPAARRQALCAESPPMWQGASAEGCKGSVPWQNAASAGAEYP